MKYRIPPKHSKLFVESEISNEAYSWLKKSILESKEKYPSLTMKEFEKLEETKQSIINQRFEKLLSIAISEWSIIADMVEKENESLRVDCELCGEKDIKRISKIKNNKNGKVLIVGSSCITEYAQMKDPYGKNLSQIRKEYNSVDGRRFRNEELLQRKFSNIIEDMKEFSRCLINKDFIINEYIESYHRKISQEIKDKYDKYIKKSKLTEEQINEIGCIHIEIKKFFEKFNEYKAECNTLFGLGKNIKQWLDMNMDFTLLSKLKKEGKITENTISYITERKFLSKIIFEFEELLEYNEFILDKNILGKYFGVMITGNNLPIEVSTNRFVSDYKIYLKDKQNFKINLKEIIEYSKITKRQPLETAFKRIDMNYFEKRGFKQVISDASSDINEIGFYNLKETKFEVIKFNKFINKFKRCIILNSITEEDLKNMLNYVILNSEKYTYEEYREHLKPFGINLKNVL